MFKTTLIAAMAFASTQAIQIRSETTEMRNDPDTMLLEMAQTE